MIGLLYMQSYNETCLVEVDVSMSRRLKYRVSM